MSLEMYTVDSKKNERSWHNKAVQIVSPYSSFSKAKTLAVPNRRKIKKRRKQYSTDAVTRPVYIDSSNFHPAIRNIREKATEIF